LAGAFFAAAFFAGMASSFGTEVTFLAAGAAFFAGAFLAAESVTLALVRAAVVRAAASTVRSDSAGRFSDELDDTNYLSSDGFSLQDF
jgi:acid phosphatase family membrane protein YuiD